MSIEAMGRALTAPIGGNAKVILIGLANHAHPDGTNSYPSIERLASYAHVDRRTAQRNLRRLEEDGFIEQEGVGPLGQTRWHVNFTAWEGGGKMPRGGASDPGGAAPVPPEPSIEPSTSLSSQIPETISENGNDRTLLLDEQLKDDQSCGREGEKGEIWPPPTKLFGKVAPAGLVHDAIAALEHYCERTGQRLKPYTGRGTPSEALTRIMRAMVDHPEVRTVYRRMIDHSLVAPWWDGEPTVGVVFGPRVVEASIQRARQRPMPGTHMRLTPTGQAIRALRLASGESVG